MTIERFTLSAWEAAYVIGVIQIVLESKVRLTTTDREVLDALKTRLAVGLRLPAELLGRLGLA